MSSGQGSSSCALDEIAEEGAEEAAKRYFVTSHVAAKAVHLWQLRQRVVMAVQKAQADVLLHRLHYALPVTGKTRRGGEMHKTSSMRRLRRGSGRIPISTSIKMASMCGWWRLCGPPGAASLAKAAA